MKNEYGLGWIYGQTKGTRWLLALWTILVLATVGTNMVIPFFLKWFMDIATGEATDSLLRVGLLAMAVVAVGGVVFIFRGMVYRYAEGKTERKLRMGLMDVILTRRLADISKPHTGELLTKLTADVLAVSTCCLEIIKHMVGGIVSAIVATVLLFFLHWQMALIMLFVTPLLMVVMGVFTPLLQKANADNKKNDETCRARMQEDLSRIMLIKAYFMRDKVIAHTRDIYAPRLKSNTKVGFWEGFVSFSGSMVGNGIFMVSLGFGAYFVMRGDVTMGSLIAIIQLLNYIVNPVATFANAIAQVGQAKASAQRIGELYNLPADADTTAAEPVDALTLIAENLCFSYDGDSHVFEDVNVTFPKGMVTGIAGKSGCGKSTLLKLLIGLYEPRQGSVTLTHAEGTSQEILPQVAYVPPADYLFSGSVTENIIMSDNRVRIKAMADAASEANILDFIESLPDGFDTMIGESGGTGSSGQAQRLAIARAIYKQSPALVFDEPTANLDAASIEKFQSAVKQLAKDRIVIIVTHDASTITVCDKVYVIEDGRVRERAGDEKLILAG